MREVVKLIAILVTCLSLTSSAGAAELLENGNFDDEGGHGGPRLPHSGYQAGVPGWEMMGSGDFWQHNTLGYYNGRYAIAMYTQNTGLVQAVAASPDDVFTLSGSMIYGITEALVEGVLALRLEFWDDTYPTGNLLHQITAGTLSAGDTVDVWKNVHAVGVAPPSTAEVRVVCDYYGAYEGVGQKGNFDDISLVDENTTGEVGGLIPSDGAIVDESTTTQVQWVNSVGTGPTEVKVWFAKDGDPNSTILSRQVISSWAGTASLPALVTDTDYHWLVLYYDDSGDTTPEIALRSTFNTHNAPPQINNPGLQFVWLDDMADGDGDPCKLTLVLDGDVTDDGKSGTPLTYLWEGIYVSPGATVPTIEIDPNNTETTTAVFHSEGRWVIQLTVDDGEFQTQGSADIYVYDDTAGQIISAACEAAQNDPMDEALTGDADGDCDGDLEDFVQVFLDWQECMSEKLGCLP